MKPNGAMTANRSMPAPKGKAPGLTERRPGAYNLKDAPKTDALLLRIPGKKDSCFSFAFLAKAKLVETEFFKEKSK